MKRFVLSALSLSLILGSMPPTHVFGNTLTTGHTEHTEHTHDHEHTGEMLETGYTTDGISIEEMHLKEHAKGFSVTGGDIKLDNKGLVAHGEALDNTLLREYLAPPEQDKNAPVIEAENLYFDTIENVTIKDITKGVTAKDKDGNDITSKLTHTTNFVEGMTGKYYVTYEVKDDNNIVGTKTVEITIGSDITYASDLEYEKETYTYRPSVKDKAIVQSTLYLLDKEGNFTPYDKGIGAHANSEITIDIAGKGYDYFISDVGANITGRGATSIIFRVYVDDNKVFDSELMRINTQLKQVKIPLDKDAKKIKLQVDNSGNGIGSDHANWGNARFSSAKEKKSDKSKLQAELDKARKVDDTNFAQHEKDNLKEAIKLAKYVIENKLALQKDVDDTLIMLTNATKKLPLTPLDIFTDKTYSKLKEEYNSKEKVNIVIDGAEKSGTYKEYKKFLDDALILAENNEAFSKETFTLSRNGKDNAKAKGFSYELASADPTGLYIIPGQEVEFYVDSDKPVKIILPRSPYSRNTLSTILQPGLNTYKLPNDANVVAINFANQYSEKEQPVAPRVRIVGATQFPLYIKNKTDMKDMKAQLEEYLKKTSFSPTDEPFKNGESSTGQYANMVQIVSDNVVISTSAAGFYKELLEIEEAGQTIDHFLQEWDNMIDMYYKYTGYSLKPEDKGTPNYRPHGRIIVQIGGRGGGGPFGTAGNYFATVRQSDEPRREEGLFSTIIRASESANWALWHEIAHVFENGPFRKMEMTTNLPTLMVQDMKLGVGNNRLKTSEIWERINGYHTTKDVEVVNSSVFVQLAIMYQLHGYLGYDWYGTMAKGLRENSDLLEGERNFWDRYVIGIAKTQKVDVSSHFEHYGIKIGDHAKKVAKNAGATKLDKRVYLTDETVMLPESVPFAKDTKITVSVKNIGGNQNRIKITSNAPKNSLLAYEIYKDNKLIGVTKENEFINAGKKGDKYTVIAVDRKYNEKSIKDVEAKEPVVEIYDDSITIQVEKTENDLKNQLKMIDQDGESIPLSALSKFEVTGLKLDEKGVQTAKINVGHQGKDIQKEVKVNVVSKKDYLSDLDGQVANMYTTSLKNNSSYNGADITLFDGKKEIAFEKGLGMSGNFEVTYNIEGKHYEKFNAKIGLDKVMNSANSQAIFMVYIDDKLEYTSPNMTMGTIMNNIEVDIPKSAKTIKLAVSTLGPNTNANTVWADAMLTTNEEKITVITTEDIMVGAKEEVGDLSRYIYAEDIRGRKLQNNEITINTEQINTDKLGTYAAIVKTNASGINAEAEIPVTVVAGKKYLSDLRPKNASIGWGGLKKDLAPDSSTISLLDKDKNEIVYPKGISAHSPSEIIYDIEGKGYDTFLAKAGIDSYATIASKNQTQVEFRVYVDGIEQYKSGQTDAWQSHKDVKVNVKDAKEIKLVVDPLGSESSDQAVWADAMFITNEEKVNIVSNDDIVIKKTETNENIAPATERAIDLSDYIYAMDTRGNKIENIKIDTSKIDTSKVGEYKVPVTASVDGMTSNREIPVKVVAGIDYLSDLPEKSVKTGWNPLAKDEDSDGGELGLLREDGTEIAFKKGLGAHAPSEIVYDIAGKGYDTFLAKAGVDRDMKNAGIGRTNLKFNVYVDNKLVYDSGDTDVRMPYSEVKIDIRDAKEIKLVANSLGSRAADHSIWADAMFVTTQKPMDIKLDKNIVMEMGEEIDLTSHIYATNSEGEKLTDIVVDKADMNVSTVGTHNVTATINNNGIKQDIEIPVEVVAKKAYLSDLDEKRASIGWKTLTKDTDAGGGEIGLLNKRNEKEIFKKGLGAHAPSEIVYDIEGKGYEKFLAKVGIEHDLMTTNKEQAKVQFRVYVDDNVKFDSKEMHVSDPYKDVEVDITGAKEIKLVADSLGSKARDHAIWADAMFTASKNPVDIYADKSITLKVGDKLDLSDNIYAMYKTGHKFENITIDDSNVKTSEVGEYIAKATITVGNEIITKDVPVDVVERKIYLSDLDAESATAGWGGFRKDLAPNGTSIDLLKPNGEEVVFKKGLGTHSPSTVVYNIEGKGYDKFIAKIGVDRYAKVAPAGQTEVEFKVIVDGKEKYNSGAMHVWEAFKEVEVDLKGAEKIELVVSERGSVSSDHAVWADAMFTSNTKAEEVATFSLEEIEATEMTEATEVIEATDIVEADKIENHEEVTPEINDNNEVITPEVNDNEVTPDTDNDSQPDTNIGADDTQNNTPNGDNLEQDSNPDSAIETLELLVTN